MSLQMGAKLGCGFRRVAQLMVQNGDRILYWIAGVDPRQRSHVAEPLGSARGTALRIEQQEAIVDAKVA
jgi:hypothetical protein